MSAPSGVRNGPRGIRAEVVYVITNGAGVIHQRGEPKNLDAHGHRKKIELIPRPTAAVNR
jgi:hypothetical protein